MVQKKGKAEFAAKFISASGKRKTMALKEMDLLSELDNERIVYFQDAFEKRSVVVLITELYPFSHLIICDKIYSLISLICVVQAEKICVFHLWLLRWCQDLRSPRVG